MFSRWKPAQAALPLDAALSGALPCITCRYELKGLSISGACPECGTAIRATILYTIDPEAEEFKPVPTPRFTSLCLVTWAGGASLAALAALGARVGDVVAMAMNQIPPRHEWLGMTVFVGAVLSALSMTGMIRTTRGTPRWQSAAVIGSIIAYVPLLYTILNIRAIDAMSGAPPYFSQTVSADRLVMRLIQTSCIILILAGVRPNARDLVKRSLALRTGRVDRQTILAMIGAALFVMMGDSARLVGVNSFIPWLVALGALMVTIGNLFITVGFVSGISDGWKIAQAILTPPPTVRDLIGQPASADSPPLASSGGPAPTAGATE